MQVSPRFIYFLQTFGDAYWHQKSFHADHLDLMKHVDRCIKHEYLESNKPKDAKALMDGFSVTKIDPDKLPCYRLLYKEKVINKAKQR